MHGKRTFGDETTYKCMVVRVFISLDYVKTVWPFIWDYVCAHTWRLCLTSVMPACSFTTSS